MQQRDLHTSEFRALAHAEIEYALAMGEREGARSWLSMWEHVEEDHPDLPKWKARIEGKNGPDEARRLMRKLLKDMGL